MLGHGPACFGKERFGWLRPGQVGTGMVSRRHGLVRCASAGVGVVGASACEFVLRLQHAQPQ